MAEPGRKILSSLIVLSMVFSLATVLAPVVSAAAPSTPVLTSPADNATVITATPTFTWAASTDPENGSITYQIQVSNSSTLLPDNALYSPIIDQSGITGTSYTPTTGLVNGTYYWHVRANDNENLSSGWSAVRTLVVSAPVITSMGVAPGSFTLSSGSSKIMTATLKDGTNNPLANKTITWSATLGGLSTSSGTTNSSGQVTVTYTAPSVTTQTYVMITASFAGDSGYQLSSMTSSGTVTVAALPSTTLSISPSSFTLESGENTTLTATLRSSDNNPLANKTISWSKTAGSLSATSGTTNSSGQVTVTYTAPTVTAQTSATVTASFSGDNQYSGSGGYSYGAITVENATLAFSPPHSDRGLDNNGDGLYDYLVIDVRVNVGRAAKYYLYGSLCGGTTTYTYENYSYGSYVGYAWQEVTLSAGLQTVSLYFDGVTIKRSAINGPYTASLSIYNETYSLYDYGTHTTGTYTYSQFGQATTSLSPPHSDSGSDTNGDGLYDYLEVTVRLNVATAGRYSVSGSLSGGGSYMENYYTTAYSTSYSTYTYIDYAWVESELSTGPQTVTLRFDGSKIRQSKVNGPYTVDLSLQKDYEWIDSGTHTTSSYTYTQFQTAAVTLAPPHSDSGSDTDGDGYYNYLVVDVKLNVTRAGTYSVSGSLMGGTPYQPYENIYPATASAYGTTYSSYGGTYIDSAWEEAELAVGTQTIRLRFNGSRIRQAGINGPYSVSISVYGPHGTGAGIYSWNWGTSDYGTHTTTSYTYTQFQPPAAAFSPPHSDSRSDTDGDGYYNYLVVGAKVNVTTPGKYHVSGSLMSGGDTPLVYQENEYYGTASTYGRYIDYASADVDLGAGTQTVSLRFRGTEIRRSGTNGPYQVSLSMSDSDWNWLGSDEYTTASYSYTDFQPQPIEFSTGHSDQGVDTDGDGLYDYLAVNVKVNVRTAGTYLVTGTISPAYLTYASPDYAVSASESPPVAMSYENQPTTATTSVAAYTPIIAMKRATLSAGAQTIQLHFPGGLIYQFGQSGYYQMSLAIVENFGTWSSLASDTYTTATSYSSSQFEPPIATLFPPHRDYGQDNDGDGLYDKLVVDLNLNVRRAGRLQVFALLTSSGYGTDSVDTVFKDVSLDAGMQSVKLEFDGWKIYSSHVEGSMVVAILLLDPSIGEQVWYEMGGIKIPIAGWVGIDTHTTGSYTYEQFESAAPAYNAAVIRQPVGRLAAGQVATVDLSERQLPTVRAIRVVAVSSAAASAVSVFEATERPTGVPEPPENSICYLTINVDNVQGQSFTLSLDKARIENLKIDVNTVKVFRFEDNWVELSIEKTGEDENYVYFEVTTPGFSLFVVTSERVGEVAALSQEVAAGISIFAVAAIVLGVFIVAFVILWLRRSTREISESMERLEASLGRFLRQR